VFGVERRRAGVHLCRCRCRCLRSPQGPRHLCVQDLAVAASFPTLRLPGLSSAAKQVGGGRALAPPRLPAVLVLNGAVDGKELMRGEGGDGRSCFEKASKRSLFLEDA
jgi:hypothetical protein